MPEWSTPREGFRRHLVDDVLAWWTSNGPDDELGGVFTCWDNAGTRLLATDKYTWSQGRWAWLMASVAGAAEAGQLDVEPQPYRERALATATFVRDHAMLPDGTTAYVTDRTGRPREPEPGSGLHTSVFTDLFAALGFAGVARLQGAAEGAQWGRLAEDLLVSAAQRISSGTFRAEPYPVPAGHRSFALPMILVGVGEQVYRANGSSAAAKLVRAASEQIRSQFVDGDDVVEMPPLSADRRDHLLARHRTPGHVLEALWFLQHAADLTGDVGLGETALCRIAARACAIGWDTEHGGLLRYVDVDGGRPRGVRTDDRYEHLVVRTWDTKLWWPHAEALYTTALLASRTGDEEMAHWHQRLHEYTFGLFPQGSAREWVQIRARDGAPLEETVALPVKDPFHIARALLMLVQLEAPDEHALDSSTHAEVR